MAFTRLGCTMEQHVPLNPAAQVISGKQASTNKLPPVISEYKCKLGTLWANKVCLWPTNWTTKPPCKLLHKISVGGGSVEQLSEQVQAILDSHGCVSRPNKSQLSLAVDTVQIFGVL